MSADAAGLRVLLVADSYPPARGGAAVSAEHLVDGLTRLGAEVTVVTHGPTRGWDGNVWRIAGGRVEFLLRLAMEGPQILRRIKPDVIELDGPVGAMLLAQSRLAHKPTPPVLSIVHGLVHREMASVKAGRGHSGTSVRPGVGEWMFRTVRGPLMLALERLRADWSSTVASVSAEAAREWARRFHPRVPVSVSENVMDFRSIPPDRSGHDDLRRKLGLPAGPTLLYAGPMRMVKGFDVLLEAMVLLGHRPDAPTLLVAGTAKDGMAFWNALVARLGLGSRVRMLGWLTPEVLGEYYIAADVLAMPSRYETFGRTMAEAMAAGLPVVASRVGGMVDLSDNGRCAVLVAPESPRELAEAIGSLLDDPARARRLGDAAQQYVRARLNEDRIVRDRVAVFRGLIARR